MPKPFLTYEQQIQLLLSKGLVIPNEPQARDALLRIGYFSLIGGYKHPFKNLTTKQYKDSTTFNDVLSLYQFDAELRHIVLHRLLIIERELKTQIAYAFCHAYGDQQAAYLTPINYSGNSRYTGGIQKLIGTLGKLACSPTDYPYINHYQTTHHNVPLWVLINAITFGSMSKMFSFLPQSLQSQICRSYPLNAKQMEQMLSVLTKFRNACAHGERLFSHTVKDDIPDLPLHTKLQIAKKGNQFIYGKRDLFAVVIAMRYLLSSEEFRDFKKSIVKQIADFSAKCVILEEEKLLQLMGFPLNWKKITSYKL